MGTKGMRVMDEGLADRSAEVAERTNRDRLLACLG